jgi:hypothetical protein
LTKAYLADKNARAATNFKDGIHTLRPIPQVQIDATTNVVPYPGAEGKFWQNKGY